MKKIATLFLVLLIVFSIVGCNTAATEETATTTEIPTLSHEDEVNEIVQWTIVNIINQNSIERYGNAYLYEDVKQEILSYISSIPANKAPKSFSIELISPDLFKIEISF